jgi:Mrr N-terminal domain
MPVIRISQQTWDRLRTYATPLEDTADDVVNIALDALEAARRKGLRIARRSTAAPLPKRNSERPKRGKRAPLKKFRVPLLETLYRLGGKAYSREIRKTIELLIAPMLRKADYELVSNAQPRWWNAICSVRNDLIRQGLFRNDSERGIWELSKRGFELMRAQAEDRSARRPAQQSTSQRKQGRIPRAYTSIHVRSPPDSGGK